MLLFGIKIHSVPVSYLRQMFSVSISSGLYFIAVNFYYSIVLLVFCTILLALSVPFHFTCCMCMCQIKLLNFKFWINGRQMTVVVSISQHKCIPITSKIHGFCSVFDGWVADFDGMQQFPPLPKWLFILKHCRQRNYMSHDWCLVSHTNHQLTVSLQSGFRC